MGTVGGGEAQVRQACDHTSPHRTRPPHAPPPHPPPSPSYPGTRTLIPSNAARHAQHKKSPVVPVLVLALVYLLQEVEVLDRVAHVPVQDDPGHFLFAHASLFDAEVRSTLFDDLNTDLENPERRGVKQR